jgi:branched-chain amino acid transport system substrate-binding protein
MRNKRTVLFTGLVFGLALVFGMTTGALADNIRIGVASPFSGNNAAYGDNIKAGVSLKLKEINDAGGINGQQIELVWGDDVCEPKEAGTVGAKFAADKSIVAVIGHLCSSATLAAMPIYVRAGLAAISPTSTNATIGDVGKGWFFRNCYTDDYQGQFLGTDVVPKVLARTKWLFFMRTTTMPSVSRILLCRAPKPAV